jgi:hypothetical protein
MTAAGWRPRSNTVAARGRRRSVSPAALAIAGRAAQYLIIVLRVNVTWLVTTTGPPFTRW